jgi:hypothetical protein
MKRFLAGSDVRLLKPGMQGTVIAVDDQPGENGEYWHTVRTAHWERREPGSNLELITAPRTGRVRAELPLSRCGSLFVGRFPIGPPSDDVECKECDKNITFAEPQ